MSEPILNFLCSHVTAEMHKPQANKTMVVQEEQLVKEEHEANLAEANEEDVDMDAEDAEDAEDDEDEPNSAYFNSCMCCYYWVSRRQKQQLAPLPMQNLLWYVRTLTGCEKKMMMMSFICSCRNKI